MQQAIQHNKSCRPPASYPPDSWALLNSADWQGKHTGGVHKLREKFEGPYRVVRNFNFGQNVELELPDGDKRHPVFHVSKVKPFVERDRLSVQDGVEDSQK